jgi:hypothetical protein
VAHTTRAERACSGTELDQCLTDSSPTSSPPPLVRLRHPPRSPILKVYALCITTTLAAQYQPSAQSARRTP